MEDNVTRLRACNDDFRVLTQQTRTTVQQTRTTVSEAKKFGSRNAGTHMLRYQTIAKASCQVYRALQRACTKHSEHVAHFRVEVELCNTSKDSSAEVKFDMALNHRVKSDRIDQQDSTWFLVSSIMHKNVKNCSAGGAECMRNLEKSLKRQLEATPPPFDSKRAKKSVRFDTSVSAPTPKPLLVLLLPSPIILGSSTSVDFCDFLRRHFRQPLRSDACVVLEDTVDCIQRVYPSQLTASSDLGRATSLGQLIRCAKSRGPVASIKLHERVCLAKTLAVAVLQYHQTPWLRLSCRSEDILFFFQAGNARTQNGLNLSTPFFNAKIHSRDTEGSAVPPISIFPL